MVEPKNLRGAGARSLALLKLVAEFGGDFSLSEIAARAGLPVSSVHRLLQSLMDAELVERADGQAYRPGAEFFGIARLLLKKADDARAARPLIHELWERWHETSAFCVYQRHTGRALVVDTIQTPHALRYVIEPHTEISLVWGSLGRAILAFLPVPERDAAIDAAPAIGPLSGRRLPAKRTLVAGLGEVRERGVAIYRNVALDLAGIAAPVRQPGGSVFGSIGMIMPNSRLAERNVESMIESVKSAALRFKGGGASSA